MALSFAVKTGLMVCKARQWVSSSATEILDCDGNGKYPVPVLVSIPGTDVPTPQVPGSTTVTAGGTVD